MPTELDRRAAVFGALGLLLASGARAQSISDIRVPLSDARNVGSESVRFSAAQLTKTAPVVALFGATTPDWHKARAAIQQAIFEGCPVSGVIMGPTDAPSSLEVYALGQLVSNPINLSQVSQSEITRLLRDVWHEYYRR
jgi:hypothetical protein